MSWFQELQPASFSGIPFGVTGGQLRVGRRNAGGTHAQLVLMHPDSFVPAPFNYQPFPNDLAEAIKKARQASGSAIATKN